MPGNQRQFQQAMNQGHSAAWDEQWDEAAAHYREAVAEFPDNANALTSLGLALYQLQDLESALEFYRQAVQAAPADPMPLEKVAELEERLGRIDQACEAHMRAAELYLQMRDVDKAIGLWSNVAGSKPGHMLAHTRLALVYERLGKKQQAVSEYLAIASLLQNAGEVGKAIQTVNRAMQTAPESKEAALALAMLQSGQRMPLPLQSRKVTTPLVAKAPTRQLSAPKTSTSASAPAGLDPISEARQKALVALAELLFQSPDSELEAQPQAGRRGLGALMRGIGINTSPHVDQTKINAHLREVVDLQARGENAQARIEIEHAIDAGLDHAAAFYDLGLLMFESLATSSRTAPGDWDTVIRHLQRAGRHADFNLGARLLLGQIYQRTERLKEAGLEYLEALRLADAQVAPEAMAESLRQAYEPVIEAFGIQEAPTNAARLCQNVSDALMRTNWRSHLIQARQQLPAQPLGSPPMPLAEIFVEARTSQVVEAITKINAMAQLGQYRAAMEEALFAIEYAPTYLPLHIAMAELLLQQGHMPEALSKLEVVARSYSHRGETDRAVEVLRRLIELAPMDFKARNRLIEQLVLQGKIDQAMDEYLKLSDVHYNLADRSLARQMLTEAYNLSQQSSVNRNLKVKILSRMADLDMQSLDWRSALRVYEQVRTLQPDNQEAARALIEMNFRLGQDMQAIRELDVYLGTLLNAGRGEQAIELMEGIVSDRPRHPVLRRRLAELYRQANRMGEAIEQLDEAGEIFLQSGDKISASETIMAILALNPPNAGEYQRLLGQIAAPG